MPVRKREGSPFYWYSFNLNGRRFRGSTGCKTLREAKEVERDQYQLAEKSFIPKADWKLQAVLSSYWHEHGKMTASANDIERAFASFQRLLGKEKRFVDITSGDLMDYRARRRSECRLKKDGTPARHQPRARLSTRCRATLRTLP